MDIEFTYCRWTICFAAIRTTNIILIHADFLQMVFQMNIKN
jgi:hypothetical protein